MDYVTLVSQNCAAIHGATFAAFAPLLFSVVFIAVAKFARDVGVR